MAFFGVTRASRFNARHNPLMPRRTAIAAGRELYAEPIFAARVSAWYCEIIDRATGEKIDETRVRPIKAQALADARGRIAELTMKAA